MDRFDLEQALMAVWGTDKDIEAIYKYVSDTDELDRDELANLLLGLSRLHNLRGKEAFDIFESLISDGTIS